MKILLFLVLIYKVFPFPADDKMIFRESEESPFEKLTRIANEAFLSKSKNTEPSNIVSEATSDEPESLDGRFDDSADDLENLNLSDFFNDTNIIKSENDTTSFQDDEDKPDRSLQYGNLYQGDIALTEDQIEYMNLPPSDDSIDLRVGLKNPFYRWPKNRYGEVTVPYKISSEYSKLFKLN